MNRARAGVGFADMPDSEEAARTATKLAVKNSDADNFGLVLAFCTGKHDHKKIFEGIRYHTGEAPIIGGSALGIITNDNLGYEGNQVGVAVLPEDLTFDVVDAGGLDKDEFKAGLELGKKLSVKRSSNEKLALLFYDSIKEPPPPSPILNISTPLINGFEKGLGKNPPLIIGGGLVGDYAFSRTEQFCGTEVFDQHAVTALISGDCFVYNSIMHGCQPMSDYHKITGIDGPVLFEIDGMPALEVINELLGNTDWQKQLPLLLVTLGINFGDKYAPYDEKNYVNRLIVNIIPEKNAVVLFEADFKNGTEFQFMRRSSYLMQESAEKNCLTAIEDLKKNNKEPFFALYIDCAGRTAGFSGAESEEASIVQKIIGKNIPLLGFYSGVEISPLLGKSRGLDWTAVLLILSRDK